MQLDALQVWLFDSKGLVVRSRGDAEDLEDHKLAFLHRKPAEQETYKDLLTAVQTVKPSVIIGISSVPPTIAFEQVQLHSTDTPHSIKYFASCNIRNSHMYIFAQLPTDHVSDSYDMSCKGS